MGIQPTELSTNDVHEDAVPVKKTVAGRSPTQIAMARLRADKIAMTCMIVVILFVLIAVFAPLLTKLFGVELNAGNPVTDLDQFNFPAYGPPDHGFTWKAPLGIEPNTGDDLPGRVVLRRAHLAVRGHRLDRGRHPDRCRRRAPRRVQPRLARPGHQLLHRRLPVAAVHPGGAGRGPDPGRPVRCSSPGKLVFWQFASLLIVLALFGWMTLARLVRGEVLSLREREFVQAARVIGVPTRRILFKELLPNLIAPIIVSISLGLPAFVTAEAGLAFLGIGVTGYPSWGQTINKAVNFFNTYPLYLYAPVLGILVLVMALNLLGDAVRDAFDPKTRR